MEETKKLLTEEEVEDIVNVLKDEKSEKDKIFERIQNLSDEEKQQIILKSNPELDIVDDDQIKDYPYNVMSKSGLIKTQALVEVDPETGEKKVLQDQSKLNSKISETVDIEGLVNGEADIVLEELNDLNMMNSLRDMDISDKEAIVIIDIIRRFENGIEISFEELPSTLRSMVNGLMLGSAENGVKISRKTVISDVLKFFATQLHYDQELISFQDVLKKELKMNSIMELYGEENDKIMTESVLEVADKYEAQGDLVKATIFRNISKAYIDARDFTLFKDAIENKTSDTKRLKREVKRFKNYVRDFNFKYNKSKFVIDDLRIAEKVLVRHCGVSIEQSRMFLILFYRLIKNMNADDAIDHTFMYYTLKNITTLDAYDKDEEIYIKRKELLSSLIEKLNDIQ